MLNIFQYRNGLQILPVSSLTLDEMGEMQVKTSDGKLYYHDGSVISAFITEAGSVSLSNKNLVDNSTFIIDNSDGTIRIGFNAAGTTGTTTTLTSSQTANRVITLPNATDTLVGKATTDTLTNKTIDAGSNTISNLINANLSGSAGITGANVATNTIANTNLSQMATHTIKGNKTGGTANVADLTGTEVTTLLDNVVGDSGSGGTKGLVPAPASGDAAANKFLKADGLWQTVPTGGITSLTGDVTATGPGASAATVALVGGSSAANIHAAELLANAATSSNTNSTIVKRDGSGNFSATTITATTSLKTPLLTDNGAGLTIQPSNNQNFTITSVGSGRVIISTNSVDLGETTTPSNPSSGYSGLYFKSNHLLYSLDSTGTERLIGSGGGAGGINYISLDTTFAAVKTDNSNAENSIGDWVAFADSASSLPTDMTGGSPNTAISRTTTANEVLDGSAGFKVVKSANNRQGEGVSCVANIPIGYRGQRAGITAPFKILSGSLVSGDLKFYLYDVTNSKIIAPYNNDVLLSPSQLTMYADIPDTCAQIRMGFYFASTSATAVTFAFDDIKIGPFDVAFGPAMSDFIDGSTAFTITGFGTPTNVSIKYRRDGDTMEVFGYATAGTLAGTAGIQLPSGYSINTTKLSTISQRVGNFNRLSQGGSTDLGGADGLNVLFYDGSTSNQIFVSYKSNTGVYEKTNPTASGDSFSFQFTIPILGWSTNVSSTNSQVFNIAGLLANGTRVTGSAPTELGQYRSYLRDAGAKTFSETNGSPTATPSAANGIKIYTNGTFASADSANQPSRYEIFVGKNKTVRPQFYQTTGRTGFISVDCSQVGAQYSIGLAQNYDPTTGIYSICQNLIGSPTNLQTGVSIDSNTLYTDCYFDLIVSENALAVQSSPNRSQVEVYTGNNFGSSSTTVRRFTNTLTNTGTAITYADSATLGATFTINEDGLYNVSYSEAYTGSGTSSFGISRNSTGLTTSIKSLAAAQVIQYGTTINAENPSSASGCIKLSAGDIIRCQHDGTVSMSTGNYVKFIITKVNN